MGEKRGSIEGEPPPSLSGSLSPLAWGRAGVSTPVLGTPEERLSSFPPSPAPNPAGGPRWRLRCQLEGEEGQSSVNVGRPSSFPDPVGGRAGEGRERMVGGRGQWSPLFLPYPHQRRSPL